MKRFFLKFIDLGKTIISDGWAGYYFITNFNSYSHE